MPRLATDDMEQHKLAGNFSFSGTRIDNLGATEYTLVTIAVDETGSVDGFQDLLRNALVTAVDACKKSPRSDNLLVRVIGFGSQYPNGIDEIHGFTPLADLDTASYRNLHPGGLTPLYDACYSALSAQNAYGQQLVDQDFGVNGICFFITDGYDNQSTATPTMVRDEMRRAITGEILESNISVLIGVNAAQYERQLTAFKDDAEIDEYRDAGDATPSNLAKLARFVSQSISSQSQALGTGGPSQNIAPTI